jgi:hypothetical protein
MKKLLTTLALVAMPWVSAQAQGLPAFIQKAGDARSAIQFQADCAAGIAIDSCTPVPTPKGCPGGQHWTLLGSGVAHCVLDSISCGYGLSMTYDRMGNPTCSPTPAAPPSVCSNGATNYPSCNMFPQPAEPEPTPASGCQSVFRFEPIGTVVPVCDARGPGPFPRGMTLICTTNGWNTKNQGSGMYKDYCN